MELQKKHVVVFLVYQLVRSDLSGTCLLNKYLLSISITNRYHDKMMNILVSNTADFTHSSEVFSMVTSSRDSLIKENQYKLLEFVFCVLLLTLYCFLLTH